MADLVVADLTIKQDSEGRYCLNDLHRAAGGERRHEPLNWRNIETYKALEKELSITGIPVVRKTGRYGGTFVVKELVYAYAMWISPKFQLKVIQAFDQLQTQGFAFSDRAEFNLVLGGLEVSRSRLAYVYSQR